MKWKAVRDIRLLHAPKKPGDAGYDLEISESVSFYGPSIMAVGTGVAVELPEGCFGLIKERSGFAQMGLSVLGGVIDNGYRGEIRLVLQYTPSEYGDEVHLNAGDRVAQLLILPLTTPTLQQVEELTQTERGAGGFGSTGR